MGPSQAREKVGDITVAFLFLVEIVYWIRWDGWRFLGFLWIFWYQWYLMIVRLKGVSFRIWNSEDCNKSGPIAVAMQQWHKLSVPARVKQYFRNAAKNLEFHVKPWSGSTILTHLFSQKGFKSVLFLAWFGLQCFRAFELYSVMSSCDYVDTEARTGGGICWPGFCISFSGRNRRKEGHFLLASRNIKVDVAKVVKFQQNNGNQQHQTQHEHDMISPWPNFEADAPGFKGATLAATGGFLDGLGTKFSGWVKGRVVSLSKSGNTFLSVIFTPHILPDIQKLLCCWLLLLLNDV